MTESTALVVRNALSIETAEVDRTVATLNASGLFPKDMTPVQAQGLARLSLAYGLDPFAEEIILFQGKPYLTIKGAMRLAQSHPQFDGMECEPATEAQRKAYGAQPSEQLWVATVWRKDKSHPFSAYGRAGGGRDRDSNPVSAQWTQEMAQKRAKHRALRDAFLLPLPGQEEAVDAADGRTVAIEQRQTNDIEAGQITALHVFAQQLGLITKESDESYREAIRTRFGVFSSQDLTQGQASALLEEWGARLSDAQDDEATAAQEADGRAIFGRGEVCPIDAPAATQRAWIAAMHESMHERPAPESAADVSIFANRHPSQPLPHSGEGPLFASTGPGPSGEVSTSQHLDSANTETPTAVASGASATSRRRTPPTREATDGGTRTGDSGSVGQSESLSEAAASDAATPPSASPRLATGAQIAALQNLGQNPDVATLTFDDAATWIESVQQERK